MNDVTNRRRGGAEFPAGGAVSFEEYLDRNGSLTYSNLGVSMLPLLRQGRDLFTVEKKGPERCPHISGGKALAGIEAHGPQMAHLHHLVRRAGGQEQDRVVLFQLAVHEPDQHDHPAVGKR